MTINEINRCLADKRPKGQGHGGMHEETKSCLDNMLIFSLNTSILWGCVRARKLLKNAIFFKERLESKKLIPLSV